MKPYTIELQRIKAMSNSHGLVHVRADAAVQLVASRRSADEDDPSPSTVLSMDEATARVFLLLLKQQIAEFDKRKPKSRF